MRPLERFPIYKRTGWQVLRRRICDLCRSADTAASLRRFRLRHGGKGGLGYRLRARDGQGRFLSGSAP